MPRNPTWAYDELIVALDLYLRDGTDARVIELSEVLNALPIHNGAPRQGTLPESERRRDEARQLRVPRPELPACRTRRWRATRPRGLGSLRRHPETLARLAAKIRAGAATAGVVAFPAAPEEGEDDVVEGKLLYRRHRVRERDASIVKRKKASVLKAHGRLACAVCGFDFAAVYGDLGDGYIECHHVVALSISDETTTPLRDLATVCSNCHRMLHRRPPWPSIDDLRSAVEQISDHAPKMERRDGSG